jgi:putative aldouronate transport system substrate-binding protein
MKKIAIKRALALTLSSVLLLGVAACNKSGTSDGTKKTEGSAGTSEMGTGTTGSESEVAEGTPFKMSAMLTTWGGIATEKPVHQEWLKLMEKKMGRPVELDITYVPAAEYDEKANLAINGNSMPDYMVTPFLYDYNKIGEQGMILDLAQYKENMPNFFEKIGMAKDGLMRISNDQGKIYGLWEVGMPRMPEDHGLGLMNMTTVRSDIFEEKGIKIPETQDEFLAAARKLKELYPDIFPVNTQFQSLNALYYANHVTNDIFWDGKDYQYGPLTEGYKDAIRYARTLFEEGLLDPEYLNEDNDTIHEKAVNDKNLMWLTMWFTTPGAISRELNWDKTYTVTLTPSNPKYGVAYENRTATNEVELSNWSVAVINSKVEDPEAITKFIDYQFEDDVIRLITWGIEGETYELDAEGNPKFVDEILNAPDPWTAGDKWGMRMSKNFRPGLQIAADTAAYVNAAPDDSVYVNGEVKRVPVEQAFMDVPYPDAPLTPPWFNGPSLQFTPEESEELNLIFSAVNTARDEIQAAIIQGDMPIETLDTLNEKLMEMGDINRGLDIYRAAKARYDAR